VLLEEEETEIGEPVAQVRTEITLNKQVFTVIVNDEQAKVNINALLQHQGRDAARTFAQRQLPGTMNSGEVYLPMLYEVSASDQPERYSDTSQHHGIVSINHLLPGFAPDLVDFTQGDPFKALTCWGDGRINFNRAPIDRVREITQPLMGTIQAQRLRDLLASSGNITLDTALDDIGISDDAVPELLQRLTLESRCYSAWISVDNDRRRWQELSVLELAPGEATDQETTESDPSTGPAEAETDAPAGERDISAPRQLESTETASEQQNPETKQEPYPRLRVFQW
jgi:hypothetical protein